MTDFKDLSSLYKSVPIVTKDDAVFDEGASFVRERYNAMAIAKQRIREVWEGTQSLYYANDWEWIVKGEGFERPVRFPTLRDFTKALVDNFMKDPPQVALRVMDETERDLGIGKKAYLEHVADSIHEKKVRRQVVQDMFFFGKGFRGVGYYNKKRKYGGGEKTLFDGIATRRLDPRHQFVDENCLTLHDDLRIDGARDYISRHNLPLTVFLAMAEELGWRTGGVAPENWFTSLGLDYLTTNAAELLEKAPVNVVRAYEYMNQAEDLYRVVAGGKTLFESSLYEAKGTTSIPAADYTFETRNDSFWGDNLASVIAPHIYTKDIVFNLELQNLKLTLQPVIAVSGTAGWQRKLHKLQSGAVWELTGITNGRIQDSIQTIVPGTPNTRGREMLEHIGGELAVATRADVRNLEMQRPKTATEASLQSQSMNAHNEAIEAIAEVESEAVMYRLMDEVMRKFMCGKDEKGNERMVPIKGYFVRDSGGSVSFVEKSGHEAVFALTERMIDVEARIEATDNRSQIASKAEKMGRYMQALPLLTNMAQANPEVAAKVDFVGLVEQAIEFLGLDPERTFKDPATPGEDEWETLKEELLLGNPVPVPPDEPRRKSMERLRFLLLLRKQYQKDLDGNPKANQAFIDHLMATNQSILRPQTSPAIPPGQPPQGAEPPAQTPMAQGATPIPQPDKGLMNTVPASPVAH